MFEVGVVRKTRRLARVSVVLGVILLFSSIGITLTSAAPNENPPGQDQCVDGHGADDKPCKEDNDHGQDCEEHGNGGVNEDHCLSEDTTTGGSTGNATGNSTGGSSTGEGTGNATGNATGGSSTGEGTGNATGNSTGEGTGNATGNATGNSTGNGTGNSTGNATGNSTGEGTTGESTTGTSTSGSSTSGSSTGAVVEDNKQLGDEVLGRTVTRKPLATTGSTTTVLAVFGFALLMIGSFLRFGRFGTQKASI
ncbi:MAG: hypothetical protein WAT66_07380 [Actinomycetota bacterium]